MTEATAKKKQVVRYKNAHTFSARVIEAKDWKGVGAEGQKTTRWDQSNDWAIPVEDFSAEALAYIKRDEDLVIVEV